MTREEAVKYLKNLLKGREDKRGKTEIDLALETAITVILQAFEMEKRAYNALIKNIQCADCISRQAVLDLPKNMERGFDGKPTKQSINIEYIKALPLVIPKQRVGQWIKANVRGGITMPCCSLCGNETGTIYEYNYCPNCGCRMQEVEE